MRRLAPWLVLSPLVLACRSPAPTTAPGDAPVAAPAAAPVADPDDAGVDPEAPEDPDLAAVAAAIDAAAAGAPVSVRIVGVTTQTWGCCGVAPFILASHPVGGPDDAYVLPVPRPGVPDPEAARRPGLDVVLWGTLRGERLRVRDWLAERGRAAPTTPDALANLDARHPVIDVDAWCVIGGVGPTACAPGIDADADVALARAEAPANHALGDAGHPVVAGEPGAWTIAATPTADGERVTLRGPRERDVTLELTLELWSYDTDGAAQAALDELIAAADPDTGLSYGWDLVERRGGHVTRLHGGCRWSRARWDALVARLQAWRGPADTRVACRCGGGCAPAP